MFADTIATTKQLLQTISRFCLLINIFLTTTYTIYYKKYYNKLVCKVF